MFTVEAHPSTPEEWKQMTNVTHPCRYCGAQVYTVSRMTTGGVVTLLAGLILSPFCVGLLLVPFAYFFMRENTVECDSCGRQ